MHETVFLSINVSRIRFLPPSKCENGMGCGGWAGYAQRCQKKHRRDPRALRPQPPHDDTLWPSPRGDTGVTRSPGRTEASETRSPTANLRTAGASDTPQRVGPVERGCVDRGFRSPGPDSLRTTLHKVPERICSTCQFGRRIRLIFRQF